MSQIPVLQLTDVCAGYGARQVLQKIGFDIPRGQCVGLLGPNGAGKTTLLSCLMSLKRPSQGQIRAFGEDLGTSEVKKRIGCTPQATDFPETSSVNEILRFVAAHYDQPTALDEILETFALQDLRRRRTSQLSGGQRRKLALACALIGAPELVILDEPTAALDIETRQTLWQALLDYKERGGTILFTTHFMEEAEKAAERILVLHRGQIIFDDSPQQIQRQFGYHLIQFDSDHDVSRHLSTAHDKLSRQGPTHSLYTRSPDQAVKKIVQEGSYRNLRVHPVSIEEAFLKVIER